MARKRVEPDPEPARILTDAQVAALGLLLGGKTPAEVAGELGTPEPEVIGWLGTDPLFVAELNRRRLAEFEAATQRIRGLVGPALDRIEALLDSDNEAVALKAAAAILKTNLADLGKPGGDTTAEAVDQGWKQAAALSGFGRW
jgi:hypothetical protein